MFKILFYKVNNDDIESKPFDALEASIYPHKGDIVIIKKETYYVQVVEIDYDNNVIKIFVTTI